MVDLTNILQPPQVQPPTPWLPQQTGTQTTASPEELKAMYEYSRALQSNQMPVRSWTQGVSNMVNALMGGLVGNKADQLARQGQKFSGDNMQIPAPANKPPSSEAVYDNAPSSKKSAPQGGALNLAPTGGSDDVIDRAQTATSKQESGGNYGEVGPQTKYGRALGKYQIMPENVSRWSEEVLGRKLSPREFLNDPAAQDQIYRAKMGQYIAKYGVEGAGRAWLGGEGSINKPDRRDILGTSVGDYGRKFAGMVGPGAALVTAATDAAAPVAPTPGSFADRFAGVNPSAPPAATMGAPKPSLPPLASNGPIPASALGFNGQPAAPAAGGGGSNAADAIVMALQRGDQVSNAPRGPMAPQVAQATGPLSANKPPPPGVLPGQSTMTKQQMINLLNSRYTDGPTKAALLQMYLGTQVNPQSVPVAGGQWIIPADRKSPPYWVPDLQKGTTKVGPIEQPTFGTLSPGATQFNKAPMAPAAPPPVQTVPVRPGVPAGQNVLPPPAGSSSFAPEAPPPVPGPQGAVPTPVKVASNDPAIGLPGTGGSPAANPMGALASVPPTVSDPRAPLRIPAEPPPVAAPAVTPPVKLAAAQGLRNPGMALPPGLDPELAKQYEAIKEFDAGLDAAKSGRINQQDLANKRFENMSSQALAAGEFLPQLRLAQNLASDKNNPQGLFAEPRMFYHRVLSELGQDTNNEAATGQVFTKVLSSSILDSLRQFTQGASVGQIRTMEITLAKLANAGLENTPEANQVLLNIAVKSHERLIEIAKKASDYQEKNGFLDSGWNKEIFQWQHDHPLLNKSEEADFRKLFAEGKGQIQPGSTAGPAAGATGAPPQGAIDVLVKDPSAKNKELFEKTFKLPPGSADQYLK